MDKNEAAISGTQIHGEVVVEYDGARTRIVLLRDRYPVKLHPPLYAASRNDIGACWVYYSSYGGGLVGGDVANVCVTVIGPLLHEYVRSASRTPPPW